MKRQLLNNAIVLTSILIFFSSWSFAWEYPIIKNYGSMNPLPGAVVQQSREATNDCFERILEGRALLYDSKEMNAIVTY